LPGPPAKAKVRAVRRFGGGETLALMHARPPGGVEGELRVIEGVTEIIGG